MALVSKTYRLIVIEIKHYFLFISNTILNEKFTNYKASFFGGLKGGISFWIITYYRFIFQEDTFVQMIGYY